MPPPYVFCPICGGPFGSSLNAHDNNFKEGGEGYWPSVLPQDELEWLDHHRLIGRTKYLEYFCRDEGPRDPSDPNFPLPKNTSDIEGFFISEPANWTFVDGGEFGLGMQQYTVFWGDEDGDPMFPIHDTCIELAKHVVQVRSDGTLMSSSHPTLVTFYESLAREWTRNREIITSRPVEFGSSYGYDIHGEYGLEWEHKYFGARDHQDYSGWQVSHGDEWLCADPLNIPELTTFVLSLLPEASNTPPKLFDADRRELSRGPSTPTKTKRGLEALPREVLDQIAGYLPISSVFSLRLSSKTLAVSLYPDQQFFFRRLLDGTLVPLVWDLESKACIEKSDQDVSQKGILRPGNKSRWDWKALAKLLAKKDAIMMAKEGKLIDAPIGFRNRCRIWKIIEAALDM